jgi:N-acetylglucosamine kinase-like BadF-type ATPase
MILVADSGSTNTNWCLLNATTGIQYFDTEGYNPYFVSVPYIVQSLRAGLPTNLNPEEVRVVYFYGSGCFEEKTINIKVALKQIFIHADIIIGLDLLGSARAVLDDNPGFAAILGTGTNSCLYDGNKIIANIDSLGYLMGDEGSGYYMGKKLLGDYIRGYMPVAVRTEFYKIYGISREEIMEQVYAEKLPNRYCAGFTRFITESVSDKSYTSKIVKDSFIDFFECLVTKYENYKDYSFNCTGSIAFTFKDILSETAALYGMKTGVILKTPIEGLAKYHKPVIVNKQTLKIT